MNTTKLIILCCMALIFIGGCKNEESHTPCGRPDCKVVSQKHTINGVLRNSSSQTYVTVNGKKLLDQTTWTLHNTDGTTRTLLTIKNEYDSEARLINQYQIQSIGGNQNITKSNFEYDSDNRVTRQNVYNNTIPTGYTIYQYNGNNTKPSRKDLYNANNQHVAYDEMEYDGNNNLVKKTNYQQGVLDSRYTYSNYNGNGEWGEFLYEILHQQNSGVDAIQKRKITQVFEGCNLKSTTVEEDGTTRYVDESTIEDGLVTSIKRTWANSSNIEVTAFTYSCN